MPQSTQRRRKGHGEVVPPSSKLDKIGDLLKIQLETFPQKELTADEITRWEMDLKGFPIEAIDYAFEQHRQLAMFFPVPAQILDICRTWQAPQKFVPGCDEDCKARHGKGYNGNDVLALCKLFRERYPEPLKRPLTEKERAALIDELDRRKAAVA